VWLRAARAAQRLRRAEAEATRRYAQARVLRLLELTRRCFVAWARVFVPARRRSRLLALRLARAEAATTRHLAVRYLAAWRRARLEREGERRQLARGAAQFARAVLRRWHLAATITALRRLRRRDLARRAAALARRDAQRALATAWSRWRAGVALAVRWRAEQLQRASRSLALRFGAREALRRWRVGAQRGARLSELARRVAAAVAQRLVGRALSQWRALFRADAARRRALLRRWVAAAASHDVRLQQLDARARTLSLATRSAAQRAVFRRWRALSRARLSRRRRGDAVALLVARTHARHRARALPTAWRRWREAWLAAAGAHRRASPAWRACVGEAARVARLRLRSRVFERVARLRRSLRRWRAATALRERARARARGPSAAAAAAAAAPPPPPLELAALSAIPLSVLLGDAAPTPARRAAQPSPRPRLR
jgi:hypothetical protein